MIGYSHKTIRLLVLIIPKTSEYVKKFKVKEGDKYKTIKLMSLKLFGLVLKA